MKKIAIAIDFSKSSLNALDYAIEFANVFSADIDMIWVNKPSNAESIYPEDGPMIKEEAERRFKEIQVNMQPKLKGKLAFAIKNGKVYRKIIDHANNVDADLIIAGTHGISGFEEFWMGSNAYRIVMAADLPVLTIRETYKKRNSVIKKIVLPIDKTIETRQKLPLTTLLAQQFDAEVHILGLYSSHYDDVLAKIRTYVNQTAEYLKKANVKYIIKDLEDDDTAKGTIDYAKSIDADLICIMTKHEISLNAYFLGLYSQHMVNHSQIPVLTVEPKELFNYTAEFIKTI